MLPCRNQTPRRGRQTWTGRTLQNPNFHSPSTYICSCDMYVSMWDISESPHVFLHDPAQSPAPRLSREGSTIHDTVKDLCLTLSPFCNFLSPPPLDSWRGKQRAGLLTRHTGRCSAGHSWLTSLGRRHGREACGHLLVVTWSRKHRGGRSVPGALAICGLEGLPQGWKQIPTGSIAGSTAHIFSLLWQFCNPTSLHCKLLKDMEI